MANISNNDNSIFSNLKDNNQNMTYNDSINPIPTV
jgi:hypothetical protein